MAGTVLMVAFHFPPAAMGSGHLRTLGFARYLPRSGWRPVVLSARPGAYPRTATIGAGTVPADCPVHRAFALDASRHLAIGGRYPGFLAQPDRWASWWPAAVLAGLRLIRRHRVDAIWSTYPIMSAHHIAHTLSRLAHLPWIADFRDPVSSSVEAGNPYSVAAQQGWERRVLADAARVVLTTPGARADYADRYPNAAAAGRLVTIGNGFDDNAMADLPTPGSTDGRPLVLVHSGLLYRDGRDPSAFLAALARLREAGHPEAANVRVMLRASGSEAGYAEVIERLGLSDAVTLAPPVSNREALLEQARADALVLFQGARFNRQIPAKVYEYLRIGHPIFALLDGKGDTAGVLRESGGATLAPLDDAEAIAPRLGAFLSALRAGRADTPDAAVVATHARSHGAATLAGLLDEVSASQASGRAQPRRERA